MSEISTVPHKREILENTKTYIEVERHAIGVSWKVYAPTVEEASVLWDQCHEIWGAENGYKPDPEGLGSKATATRAEYAKRAAIRRNMSR